jgi:catechol 2,3-dioxygenase-like lactoylglutathione lyase family enzyme
VTDWDWSRIVFDHVKLGVRDAEASKTFYRTVLATLDIPPLWESDRGAQYANLVVSGDAEPSSPVHIGFVARSRQEVDAFHRAGVDAAFEDNGPPGRPRALQLGGRGPLLRRVPARSRRQQHRGGPPGRVSG